MKNERWNETDKKKKKKSTYIHFNDLLHARAGSFDDGLDVVAAGLGLVADAALDELGRGVCGDLARDEDLAVCAHGLGLVFGSVNCVRG